MEMPAIFSSVHYDSALTMRIVKPNSTNRHEGMLQKWGIDF